MNNDALRDLAAKWRSKASEIAKPYGFVTEHALGQAQELDACADALDAAIRALSANRGEAFTRADLNAEYTRGRCDGFDSGRNSGWFAGVLASIQTVENDRKRFSEGAALREPIGLISDAMKGTALQLAGLSTAGPAPATQPSPAESAEGMKPQRAAPNMPVIAGPNYNDRPNFDRTVAPSQVSREGCVGTMTPDRVAFFLERFKREEKLLGPHEQWALDYAIAAVTAPSQVSDAIRAAIHEVGQGQMILPSQPRRANDRFNEAIKLLRAALDQPQPGRVEGWQPIETAPKDGTPLLLVCMKPAEHLPHRLGYMGVCGWDDGWGAFNRSTFPATHWQPLPALPTAGGDA